MPRIVVDNVSISYPVYGTGGGISKLRSGAGSVGSRRISRSGFGVSQVQALDKIAFALEDGDRLGLIGRNGSGKSTLLRVLSGIYQPDGGHVLISGRMSAVLEIGLGIRHEATGFQNIKLRLLATNPAGEVTDELIERLAAFTELGEFLHMPVRTYSRGMLTRLAFTTATAGQPEILILDEWIGAGDMAFQKKAQTHMQNFVDGAGIVIIASHNAALIRNICNKAAWIDRGSMRMLGDVEEVLAAYESGS
ncbi:MAG: ABC transporter ATP-binding protein [Hyphomicrobiaceae bacterium]|nr:ABC transporter ATP-binding protein [Hyphomicrobiaceae bacterium]